MHTEHYAGTKSVPDDLTKIAPYLHDAIIAEGAKNVYWYASKVLQAPFPAGENLIAKDAHWAYYYARSVLKGAFPAGEKAIASDGFFWNLYTRYIKLPKGHPKK